MTFESTMDNTMGALFIGMLCSAALLGAIIVQCWSYFSVYKSDPLHLKAMVLVNLLVSIANQGMSSAAIYQYVVTNFFNPKFLDELTRVIIAQNFLNVFTTISVQLFFIYRIWQLTRGNLVVVLALLSLAIAQTATAIAFTVRVIGLHTFSEVHDHAYVLGFAYNAVALAANVAITGVLCTVLLTTQNEFARTENFVDKVFSYVISTGLITTLCVAIGLASYAIVPKSAIYICVLFITSRTHCVSLMTSLHLRPHHTVPGSQQSQSNPLSLNLSTRPPSRPLQFVGGRTFGQRQHGELSEDGESYLKIAF